MKKPGLFTFCRSKKEGKPTQRVGNQPITPEKVGESTKKQPLSEQTEEKGGKIQKTTYETGTQLISESDSEITTSRNSMRLEMKNTLADISSRLCELE